MVNTNPQVIYNKIYCKIGIVIDSIAREMLDLNNNNVIQAIVATSKLTEDEIKYKIWKTCVKKEVLDKDEANNYQVEQAILDLFHDSDEDSRKLHSFDIKGPVCQMITLINMLNNKVLGYNS